MLSYVYKKLLKVGEGSYGKVFKAIEGKTRKLVALKNISFMTDEEGIPPTALREVSLLQTLSESNHVVKLVSVEKIVENNISALYLAFEYLTDLNNWLDRIEFQTSSSSHHIITKSIIFQIIKGVAYCHCHGIIHRDLKPHNILVEDNPLTPHHSCIKVADFGLSRSYSIPTKSYTHEIITLWYRAPEILLGADKYNIAVDMWSIGCIFAELLRGQPLFSGDSEIQQLLRIFSILGTPLEDTWEGVVNCREWHEYPHWNTQELAILLPNLTSNCKNLLASMLIYQPVKRISAKKAVSHPYFQGMENEI